MVKLVELKEVDVTKIAWPTGRDSWQALMENFATIAFFLLDQLLPKHDGVVVAMKTQVLAEVMYTSMSERVPSIKDQKNWTIAGIVTELNREKRHPLLIHHPRLKAFSPTVRTGVIPSACFADGEDSEEELSKMMRLGKSDIHGTGVFANTLIPKNTVIRNCYKGVIRYVWETDGWSREADCYNMSVPLAQDLLVYCPLNRDAQPETKWTNPYVFYFNRQKLPLHVANVRFFTPPENPWLVWVKTLREIQPGEEMLLDTYGTCYEL